MDSWIHVLTKKSQHTVFRVCLQIRQRAFISYYSKVWSLDFIINKPGLIHLENRYDLFTPEKIQLKFLKNVLEVQVNIQLMMQLGQNLGSYH